MPPPKPSEAVASIRATLLMCEFVFTVCGDCFFSCGGVLFGACCSKADIAVSEVGCRGDADLSLCCDEVRGVTLPFCIMYLSINLQ